MLCQIMRNFVRQPHQSERAYLLLVCRMLPRRISPQKRGQLFWINIASGDRLSVVNIRLWVFVDFLPGPRSKEIRITNGHSRDRFDLRYQRGASMIEMTGKLFCGVIVLPRYCIIYLNDRGCRLRFWTG